MRLLYKLSVICILILLSINCEWIGPASSENEKLSANFELVDTEWRLVSFQREGEEPSGPGTVGVLIEFVTDSTFKGRSYQKEDGPKASNQYGGKYQILKNNKIEISDMGTTLIGEPKGSKYFEFYNIVHGATHFEIDSAKLKIFADNRWVNVKPYSQ